MPNTRRTALGRGLSALIPEASSSDAAQLSADSVTQLPIEHIRVADNQPRTHFDDERISALSDSIKSDGILQPIVVRRVGQATFVIIAGERRYRASRRAGLSQVPVIIKDVGEQQAYELALIENVQREDLNPIEEAHAYQFLAKEGGLSHEAIAQRVGRDRVTITNTLRLLKLTDHVTHLISTGRLRAGHARAILMAPKNQQNTLADTAVREGWSVRQTERAAKALKETPKDTTGVAKSVDKSAAHQAVEAQLRAALGAPINLVQKSGKGRIEVRFHTLDELERLIDLIATLEGQ